MRKLIGLLIVVMALTVMGADSYAQISSAAVLFLRIAAGARAAGMGEAYVAIADDATATHWNPAGLGQYPLSSRWDEILISEEYLPIRDMTLYSGDGSANQYSDFAIWMLTSQGLVKYEKGNWINRDIISTTADQSVESILRNYAGIYGETDSDSLKALFDIIGQVNNLNSPDVIDSLEVRVMAGIAEDYKSREDLVNAFVALKEAYNQCLIDWEKFLEAQERANKGLKDSTLNETEADRILFAVEKARRNYLPSEIVIPFSVNRMGGLNDLAADEDYLYLAAENGLYRYNGANWQHFGINDGLPMLNIGRLSIYDSRVFMATDTGVVVYFGGAFTHYGPEQGLPQLPVSAITATGNNKAWAVVDNDLFQYDGTIWRNYAELQSTGEHSAESIYEIMKIYDTPAEKELFMTRFKALNPWLGDTPESPPMMPGGSVDELQGKIDSMGVLKAYRDSQMKSSAPESEGESELTIKIPYTSGLKTVVRDMEVDSYGNLWLGTDQGVMMFSGRKWRRFGYRRYTPEKDIAVFELALGKVRGDSSRAELLADNIREVNDLKSETIAAGQAILLYANPAGARVNDILVHGNKVVFATSSGAIFFDSYWDRYNARDLGYSNVNEVFERDGNLWFLTRDRIEINAAAKSEITLMHVNWLPELASDIYYEFLGYTQNIEGWGTVGANITFLSYGNITRTSETGAVEGEFSAFDIAFTLSYGVPLTQTLSGGISAKIIYSHLSELGAGREKGSGTSTGLALDLGLLYKIDPRLSLGIALTNLGPDISYIDVSQSDPLPRNLAVGVAWKMIQSNYNEVLFTVEANKSLAERDKTILEDFRDVFANPQDGLMGLIINPFTAGGLTDNFKGVIINGGVEYKYASFFTLRAGYIHDEEGEVKTLTLGAGLSYNMFGFDFAYIPSSGDVPLANTMRFSLSVGW
nr:PorV/PorQ family protein [candidate division Zixibacteria bacterium]